MAAPDELPLDQTGCRYPIRITTYGGVGDSFLRVVDTLAGHRPNGTPRYQRVVLLKPKLDFISNDFTIGEDEPVTT